MSTINFCETKEQLNHLGEVVTGKVGGSPTGADIETSTLPYTGQVRNTLPALEELYLGEINEFIQESDQVITDKTAEFDTSIANKEAEASAAIDAYRLLSKGPYAAGIELEDRFQYITYNGESYFAVNPPYTTTATLPDVDGNLFAGGYLTSQQLSVYTDIVYKASGGNSAVENMIAGTPVFTPIGGACQCEHGTLFKRIGNATGGLSDYAPTSAIVNVADFGAMGDGVSDSSAQLQLALDFQYDWNCELRIPSGVYVTTKPLHLWTGTSKSAQHFPIVRGSGRSSTIIKKINQSKSELVNHTDVDSVIIIANTYSKEGNVIDVHTTSQTNCANGILSDLSLESDNKNSERVANAIWTYGITHWTFDNIGCTWTTTGMFGKYWNVYCKYRKMEMERTQYAFNFGETDFGSNTTMNFEDCHCNGVDGICYNIIGIATLLNCSIDGGGGTHIKIPGFDRGASGFLTGRVVEINCHHESPAIFENNAIWDLSYGTIVTRNSSLEIPYINTTSNSVLLKMSRYSKAELLNQSFGFREGATPHSGSLFSKTSSVPGVSEDPTCRISMQGTSWVDTEAFDTYKIVNYNSSGMFVIGNRGKLINTESANRFIQYVSGSVPSGERSTTDFSTTSSGRSVFTTTNNFNRQMATGFMMKEPLNLTGVERIALQGTLGLNHTGTGAMLFGFSDVLVNDGAVGVGAKLVPDTRQAIGKATSNYNATDDTWYVDVSDLDGTHYVAVIGSTNDAGFIEIQELRTEG